MSDKKVIAIIGATGSQGGGLVEAILQEQEELKEGCEFAIRAITRNPTSEKSLSLKKYAGIEVVKADVNDEASITEAIRGAYGLFCVSFYWENMDPDEERRQARNMAFAAREAGVKHVIWSTLEDSREHVSEAKMPTLMGNYKLPHFEAKAESDRYFAEAQVPTTYLVTSFYWDNFLTNPLLKPKKLPNGDDKWEFSLPMGDKLLAGIASSDIGRCAFGIFHQPDVYINQRVGIMGEALKGWQIAETMSAVLKKEIRCNDATDFELFRSQISPGAAEFGNMFQYFHDCEEKVLEIRSVDEAHKLNPNLMSFDQWMEKNNERFKLDD